jgi:2-polyprenyl-3-methyl-5-hydroxy-6-metoxy-1,4-benzoquinol methylase
MFDQQRRHAVLPQADHDEAARQGFVGNLRRYVMADISAGTRAVYDRKVRPRFRHDFGRDPKDRHEVKRAMVPEPYYQAWAALLRTTQELMWDSVGESVARQLPTLMTRARRLAQREDRRGSLRLDPTLAIPRYQRAVDIHVMPGSYHADLAADDVFAGALYDRGLYLYAMGGLGPCNEDIGGGGAAYLKQNFPGFRPRRILDMGCTIGNSTLAYKAAYPDAEVHGIDLGAASLRYAHARAESLGAAIHFSQQNAERTDFAAGSFDLVVSAVLLHETSSAALPKILAECRRLLRPGGVMCHTDVPQVEGDAFDLFVPDWDTEGNNEPFMSKMRDLDLRALCAAAGFRRGAFFSGYVPNEHLNAKRAVTFRGGEGRKGKPWAVYGATAP